MYDFLYVYLLIIKFMMLFLCWVYIKFKGECLFEILLGICLFVYYIVKIFDVWEKGKNLFYYFIYSFI